MKLVFFLALGVFAPTFMLAQTEIEPNAAFGSANPLTIGSGMNASINPANDNDYFKFTISQPGVVTIGVTNVPSNIGMDFWFYNTNQQQVYFNDYNGGQNFSASFLLCEIGTYYIRFRDIAGDAAQYTLLITFDISDTYECNNSIPEAKQISLNSPVKASIWPASDEDFYKITIAQPGVLTVAVNNIPNNIGMDYWLYDINQQQIYFNSYNGGQNFSVPHLLCDTGTYYIRLRDLAGNAAQYMLLATLDISDIYECNNSLPVAKPISLNTTVKASIWPASDEDYYKIEITKPGVLTVEVNNIPSNIGMDYWLYGPNQQQVYFDSYNDGLNFTVSLLLCDAGTYYIRLRDLAGNAAQYTLLARLDTSDIYECNNDFATAKPIKFCNILTAAINAKGDKDYYKYKALSAGTVYVNVTNVAPNITMEGRLYKPDHSPLTNPIYAPADEQPLIFNYLLPDSGTYYLVLNDRYNDNFNASLYTLNVKFGCTVSSDNPTLEERIKIYPNPVEDNLFIDIADLNHQNFSINIINSMGSIMLRQIALPVSKTIDLSHLPKGLYFVHIGSKDGFVTKQFVKQ